jgi:hypothetical protein
VIGYDSSDADVYLIVAPSPPLPVETLAAWLDGGDVVFTWLAPGTDPTHGPAESYRLLRSSGRQVPFQEAGTTMEELYREPLALDAGSRVVYFKVIAANSAGSAAEK